MRSEDEEERLPPSPPTKDSPPTSNKSSPKEDSTPRSPTPPIGANTSEREPTTETSGFRSTTSGEATTSTFVGINAYMPLADWRDGNDHKDAVEFVARRGETPRVVASIRDVAYLADNIAGGEGFDWFYQSPEHRRRQIRTPINDGPDGETWLYRYKDVAGWWSSKAFRASRWTKTRPTDAMASEVEADSIHRNRMSRRRQGRQRAQRISRSEVVRKPKPKILRRR